MCKKNPNNWLVGGRMQNVDTYNWQPCDDKEEYQDNPSTLKHYQDHP